MAYDVKAAYEKKKKEAVSGAGYTAGAKKYNVEASYISAKKEEASASSLPTGEKKQSVVQGKPKVTPNNAADILKQTVTKDFEASRRISASPASLDAIQRQQIMDEAVRQLKIRQGLDTAAKIAVDNSQKTTQPQVVADQQRKAAAVPYQTALKSYADSVKRAYAADPNDNTKTDAKQVPLYLASELGTGFMSTLGGIYSGAAQTVGDLASGGKYSEITKYFADNPADRQALEIAYKSSPKDGGHIYDVILGKVAAATGATKEMVHQARRSFETDDLAQEARDSFDVSSGFKNTAGNVAFMVGQQIPAMLLTAGGSGAAFEAAISQGIMAGSAYGQKLKENSKKYGFDMGSYASAVAAGAIEALTENLDNFTPTMNSILKIATLGDLAKTAIGEGLEEAVGYPIENIIDWLVLDGATNREGFGDPKKFSEIFDMGEWTRNFIDGTVVGGLIGAGGVIANIAGQRMNGTISAQEAVEKVANAIRKNGIELQTPDVNTATDAEADQFVREAASALVVQAEEVKAQAAQQEQQGVPEQANNLAAQNEVAAQAQQTAGAQPKKGAEVATEMGLGKHGAEAAEKAGITPENVGVFTAYWNAGHEGRSLESVQTSQGGLDEVSQKLAYNAGQQDAAEEGLDVREWTTYDGRQEATGDGESILRQGGERYDGQSSGQPIPEMEAGTGRYQSGYVQTRPEESRVVGLEYSAEKVNSKQAGLEDGLEDDGIYLIKGGTSLDYMDAEAEAKRLGLEFVPFAGGDIHTLDAPDGARGCVANGKMYVRMDDPDFSGAQIARHEGAHELIRRGVIDVKKTLQAVADKYGESFVKRMTSLYNAAYAGMDLTEDEIETEMVCDARGQMNIFKGIREFAQDAFELTETVLPRIREEASNGGGTRAGPEGAQYSRNLDERRRALRPGEMVNKFRDKVNWQAYYEKLKADKYNPDYYDDGEKAIMYLDGYTITLEMQSNGEFSVVDRQKGHGYGQSTENRRPSMGYDERTGVSGERNADGNRSGRSGERPDENSNRGRASSRGGKNAEGSGEGRSEILRVNEKTEKVGVELDEKTESAAPGAYSRRTWLKSQYATDKAAAAKALIQQLDVSMEQAEQYIDNVNSVAKMIADDEVRLDYEAAPGMSSFVGNTEYGGSIDFSTICKKRRLLTGTFEAIQRLLPNTALTAEEVLTIRKMMADRGYEVSCGLCYVEGSRANMGQYTKQFLDEYAKTNPKYLPNMAEMNTASGQEKIRIQHPEVYAAYEKFMNSLAQRKPKMYQMATEYQGEILKKFKGKKNVAEKNKNGGLRLQSFSDFEIIHLIDCMQVIMDMSQVGLAGQAYTKVPDFAAALGDTGLKINLSLIAKGVDAKGKLVLDEVEGMARADAEKLRNQYSDNVGTVLVVFTDVQLQAAMNDPFIDYIIPFHRSQWNSQQYELMGLPKNAKDFTSWQNESYIEPVYSKSGKKQRPANYMPNEYWDFSKSGTENANIYLQMCHENNRRPKFHYLLDKNADGSYSLKKDGSTDGYWKLLIDFKMYNNEGVGVEQAPVKPEFNMTEAERMLRDYQGGHETFPAARDVVDEFVDWYKKQNPRANYSRRLDSDYMKAVQNGDMETAQRMVDEAAEAAGYIPVYRYHQTGQRFNEFSNNNPQAGLNDSDTPNGYFFKENDHDIGVGADFVKTGHGGSIQMKVFLKHRNMLRFENRAAAQKWYAQNVPGYAAALAKYEKHLEDFDTIRRETNGKMFDELNELDKSGNSTPERDLEIMEKYDKILDDWISENESYSTGLRAEMRRLLNQYFIENDSGYDAIELVDDGHRYIDMKREDVHTFIVFQKSQIKSADPVTYDDNGDVIPLSKRFDPNEVDIRLSRRLNTDDLRAALDVYREQYGVIEPGEKPFREIQMPRKTGENENVSKTVRTILEAKATPEAAIPTIEQMVANGDFSYETITDKQAIADAQGKLTTKGWSKTLSKWLDEAKNGTVSKDHTATGWSLYNNAANAGDLDTAMTILEKMVLSQRNAAQALQATRVLKKLSPEAQLYAAQRSVEDLQEELNERYGGKKITPDSREKEVEAAETSRRDTADSLASAYKSYKRGKRNSKGNVGASSHSVGEPFVFEYAQKVGEAVARGLEVKEKKEKTYLQQIVSEIKRFASEKIDSPQEKKKASTATDLLRDYVQNREFFQNAWEAAQNEIRAKHGNDPMFLEFIGSGIGVDAAFNPKNAIFVRALVSAAADSGETAAMISRQMALGITNIGENIANRLIEQTGATGEMAETIRDAAFSYVDNIQRTYSADQSKLLDSAIRSAMRDIGVTMTDVIYSNRDSRLSVAQAVADKLAAKYGFGSADASRVGRIVADQFSEMVKNSARSKLESVFRERNKSRRKTVEQQMRELGNLGAFDADSEFNEAATKRILQTDHSISLKIDPELARQFLAAKTQSDRDAIMAEIYKDVGKQMPSTFRDKWNAWRYLAMLGNPRTHVRNILGNAGFVPVVAAKNLTATAIEKAVNAVTGGKTGRSKAVIGTSAKDKALLSAAWADYDNVQGDIMAGGKYSDFQIARQNIEEGRRIFKNRVLEAARRGNSRAMEAEDAWFSKPHYAYALAGYCKANGITPEMITDGKAIQTARAYAIREAQKATYRDTNAFSQTISDLGKVNKTEKNGFKNGMGVVLQGILPFRKTPANILVRGVEYSPIGLVKTIALDSAKVKRGDMTATEMIDNLSAGLTGTGLLALGAFLAAQGLIRGHGPDDDKKEFEELQGHQAYSLEVGGTSITLDWLAPECLPFFVGVNLYEQARATGEELTMSTILSAITNVSEPMLEMSCMQSLNDVFDAVGYASSNDLSAISSILASAATSYLTQALPTIFGQAERTGQDVRYTTYTTKDAFLTRDMQYAIGSASARIPGWDYNQIPYIDAWGRREDTGGLAARAFGNFANPSYTSNITGSEMEDELMRVYDETGDASVFPTRAQRSFPVDGEQHYLSADEYVRYATTKGETSYNLVSDLVEMRIYDRMSEEDKVDAISDAYSLANVVAKYEVSDYETTGWMAKAVAAKKIGIDYSKYLEVRLTVKDIESIKDADGDSVSNSKGLLVMEAIYKIPGLNDKQRRQLFEDFNVGKSIIDLNKAAVEAKLKNMR